MASELDLEPIKRRAEAATGGPWWAWDRGVGWEIAVGKPADDGYPAAGLPEGTCEGTLTAGDAEFIAAARSSVPALIAEVERLRAQLDEVKALHTDSIIGPCPSCYRPGDVSDTDDGLVWWPCPTLRALGKEPVTVNLFPVLGGTRE